MKKGISGIALGLLIALAPNMLSAAGPHDGITCLGCHSTHFAVDDKLFAVKNTKMKNPLNRESFDKLTAKNCLGCHELTQFGGAGIRPVHMHTTHPIGMVPNPKIASVPKNLLKNGMLDCISCHEAHPSNKNFMYLRVNTNADGGNIQKLCAVCHDAKVDYDSAGIKKLSDIRIFSAMDQEKGSGFFLRDDVVIQNPTKSYIKPLGKLQENDIMPNYQNQPDWVYAPTVNPLDDFKDTAKPKKK
ncbi:hypothetical protein HUE87_07400 [Candidatus Sulfurimonas marisnigri]|uniref:Doubled CXXCH motif domain-containing protein n=1 Tax=Candidatus Sulfurimonas marisnigri TaxID=2740405 RepID=A0A7S7RPM7_9BACT|nr:cytochrome c3 family protein [Candidatus Sulfurimonas marisnigri]QOY53729.1 hypothetical protein HUE87_07400 [Candidatus Sulfurimonas marisnigri]